MTVSDPPQPKPLDYNPDEYRMTIGEHLEELRGRMIRALIGLVLVGALCLWFGKQTMAIFCAPLVHTLQKYDLSPQLHSEEVADIFMSYIQIRSPPRRFPRRGWCISCGSLWRPGYIRTSESTSRGTSR
jgi:hypothetical protein